MDFAKYRFNQRLSNHLIKNYNTAMKKYKCTNAFKEAGKTYRYNDVIEETEYQKISDRNKKWFYLIIEETEDTLPEGEEIN